MAVNTVDRRESRVEFDRVYFRVYDDAMKIIQNNFGADKELREERKGYIAVMSDRVLKSVTDLGTHIRIANSIFPKYRSELEERRLEQEKAIGLCYDLLTKYQLAMTYLKVKDNKYVQEIKNLSHEINCLKRWRDSDRKRFSDLG